MSEVMSEVVSEVVWPQAQNVTKMDPRRLNLELILAMFWARGQKGFK
jgi:hypothetical protein